jgi:hypothetical protein
MVAFWQQGAVTGSGVVSCFVQFEPAISRKQRYIDKNLENFIIILILNDLNFNNGQELTYNL